MADYKWRRIDVNTIQYPPRWLTADDFCYYAREFTVRRGYTESKTNQLIFNLKKPVSHRGMWGWHYKAEAIQKFAQELATLLSTAFTVTYIPTSKTKNHPDYDSRLKDTLTLLQKHNNKICVEFPIIRTKSILAKHKGGMRDPDIERQSLKWVGFKRKHSRIVLIDDVITSGSGFKACQQLILENSSGIRRVGGVFWARAIYPEAQEQTQ